MSVKIPTLRFETYTAVLIAMLTLAQGHIAYAWPPTFSEELNVTNRKIHEAWAQRMKNLSQSSSERQKPGPEEQKAATLLSEEIAKLCGSECTIKSHTGKFKSTEYQVKFKDGWGFNISVDPGVVEVQVQHETNAQLENSHKHIQKYLYGGFKAAALTPTSINRANDLNAHLNIGFRSAFDNDPVKFMKFFIDYANHPGLALGLFGENFHNAPTLAMLKDHQIEALEKIIDDVNSRKIKHADEAARRINYEVYTESPDHPGATDTAARHYQAFGLKHMIGPDYPRKDMPSELRAVRMPTSAADYRLMTQLMEKRIAYTNSRPGPVRFNRHKLTGLNAPDKNMALALTFYFYTQEMGESWIDYQGLIEAPVRKILRSGEVETLLSQAAVQDEYSERREKRLKKLINLESVDQRFLQEHYPHLAMTDVSAGAIGIDAPSRWGRKSNSQTGDANNAKNGIAGCVRSWIDVLLNRR